MLLKIFSTRFLNSKALQRKQKMPYRGLDPTQGAWVNYGRIADIIANANSYCTGKCQPSQLKKRIPSGRLQPRLIASSGHLWAEALYANVVQYRHLWSSWYISPQVSQSSVLARHHITVVGLSCVKVFRLYSCIIGKVLQWFGSAREFCPFLYNCISSTQSSLCVFHDKYSPTCVPFYESIHRKWKSVYPYGSRGLNPPEVLALNYSWIVHTHEEWSVH